MFVTIAEVAQITGVTVTDPDIAKAQAIIEVAAGRTEGLISDTATTDLEWLKRATAWQTVYMKGDPTSIFEQANVESTTQDGGFKIVIGDKWFWLSALALAAINKLSWKKSRSIKTTPFDYRAEKWRQDRQAEWMRGDYGWTSWL